MRADDFFIEVDPLGTDWAVGGPSRVLNNALVRQLRISPMTGHDDIEVAVGLSRLVHDDLERFGTDGREELTETQIREAILALIAVVRRLGLADFALPFRDFSTFKSCWLKHDGYGSWQARRDLLNDLFDPLHGKLVELETQTLTSTLATAVSPHPLTGWARVDAEISELRRHFEIARTEQDYRNIGNDCVTILEALSAQVYDPAVHLREGETEPPVSNTKQRLERFIEHACSGADNEELRGLARRTVVMAQAVKHRPSTTRRDAGIGADAVILLANMLRRLAEPTP